MYITHTAACVSDGTWEPYAGTKNGWTLAQANSTATVYVKFRDALGNESGCVSDTIMHDDQAPTIAFTSPAASKLAQSGLTIQGTCETGLTINLSGDVSTPSTTTCPDGTFSQALTFAGDAGTKNIVISQTDAAGNSGSANRDFIRDILFASKFIASSESTTSTAFEDLTTPDTVTFEVPSAMTVLIEYKAQVQGSTYTEQGQLVANVDGADIPESMMRRSFQFGGAYSSQVLTYPYALTSGSHTIKIRHAVTGGTATWSNRLLTVRQASAYRGTSWITAAETRTSGAVGDLTTPDSVYIDLTAPTTLFFEYSSQALKSAGVGTPWAEVNINGVAYNFRDYASTSSGFYNSNVIFGALALGTGSYTIKIQHAVDTGNATWSNRALRISEFNAATQAYNYIAARESTTSATPVDLVTPDTTTFTLTETGTVILEYKALADIDNGSDTTSTLYLD